MLVDSAHSAQAIMDPKDAAEWRASDIFPTPGRAYDARKREKVRYTRADGSKLSESDTLKRIRSLAIPPAWTGAWICPWAGKLTL